MVLFGSPGPHGETAESPNEWLPPGRRWGPKQANLEWSYPQRGCYREGRVGRGGLTEAVGQKFTVDKQVSRKLSEKQPPLANF